MNTFFILFSYPQKEEILPMMHLALEKDAAGAEMLNKVFKKVVLQDRV